MSIYAKTLMDYMPESCAGCEYSKKYGLVGDVKCQILNEYFTGNRCPPYKARPDKCPLVEGEDEDADSIETPEACPFCYFYDVERSLCMNRDSPCCGQWIKDITFGCNLFEASEQAVGRSKVNESSRD